MTELIMMKFHKEITCIVRKVERKSITEQLKINIIKLFIVSHGMFSIKNIYLHAIHVVRTNAYQIIGEKP